MKKLLLLTIMAATVISINAQQRKTWDFTAGVSDETIENLDADDNWTVTYNDDGSFYQATDASKMYGTLSANGVEIAELSELTFTSTGLSSGSNFILRSTQFRMTRANMGVTFRVAPGATITIRCRSANSSAEDRGFIGDENCTYISGPDPYTTGDNGGVCLGSSVSGASPDSDGNYTLVWQVTEDSDEDSLDVTLSCYPSGGLDIASFMIDEGDETDGDATNHVLYLYDSTYPDYEFGEADFIYDVVANNIVPLLDDADITAVDISTNPTELDKDSLETFSLVILSNALSTSSEYISTILEAVAYVPMLNTSPDLYEAWEWGTIVDAETGTLTIGNKAKSSSIFTNSFGESMLTDGEFAIYPDGGSIRGYEPSDGSYIASDSVWATANGVKAMHIHNSSRNAYMMFPIVFPIESLFDDYADFMENIVNLVMNTKTQVTQSGKPRVSEEYISTGTNVSLTCSTSGATIYYTLDGTDPTTESTVYTGTFFVSEEGTTLKAFSTADGYDPSDINEAVINIYELLPVPTISYDAQGDTTVVTITGNSDEDVIYFNITGSEETTGSQEYTEEIKVTKHVTMYAFVAARGSYLQSELASLDIPVTNENVRLDEVSHFDAASGTWGSSNPTYYNTKSGHPYYSDEIIGTDDDGDTVYGTTDSVVYYAPDGVDWEVKTLGQVIYWQSNSVSHNIGDGSAYNPETALDDDTDATASCVTFGSRGASNSDGVQGPAYTASIQSIVPFQGPFDLVSNICITGSSELTVIAYVTTDTLSGEWEQLGYLKTGTVKRLWKHTVLGYEGTDAVYVKVVGDSGAGVFDLFIKNAGELSEEYINGIVDINAENKGEGELLSTAIYNINGIQQNSLSKGINIIREVYSNGTVKVRKVAVK